METVYNIVEWLIVLVTIVGGISLLFADPITSGSFIADILGTKSAGLAYFASLFVPGVCLGVAKVRKLRALHKYSLMSVYLVSIWLVVIETILLGPTFFVIDEIVLGVAAAACWLRWKFKTEYLPPKHVR